MGSLDNVLAIPSTLTCKPTKKKPVEAKLSGNQKKWWPNR